MSHVTLSDAEWINLNVLAVIHAGLQHDRPSTCCKFALDAKQADYNLNRPHSRLGWLTPTEYADTFNPRRDLAPRSMQGSAPAPVAHHGQIGQTNHPSLRHAG